MMESRENQRTPRALGSEWAGGYIGTAEEALHVANSGRPFGATLWGPRTRVGHTVWAQRIADGLFLVRDTDPGVSYTVNSAWLAQWMAGGIWRL